MTLSEDVAQGPISPEEQWIIEWIITLQVSAYENPTKFLLAKESRMEP